MREEQEQEQEQGWGGEVYSMLVCMMAKYGMSAGGVWFDVFWGGSIESSKY